MGSRGALGALMTCLRAARAQGVLKPADEQLWGTMVPFPVLKQALVHKHDQVSPSLHSVILFILIFLSPFFLQKVSKFFLDSLVRETIRVCVD